MARTISTVACTWAVIFSNLVLGQDGPVSQAILVVSKQGYWLLAQDASGVPSLIQITQVVNLDSPVPPPVPPPTPGLTVRARAIRDAALAVTGDPDRAGTTAGLSVLYTELARQVREGKIVGSTKIAAAARGAADMLLFDRRVLDQWKPMRNVLTAQWTAVMQEGGVDADYAKLMEECAAGLRASIPANELTAIDWDKWLPRILQIIELILKLLG